MKATMIITKGVGNRPVKESIAEVIDKFEDDGEHMTLTVVTKNEDDPKWTFLKTYYAAAIETEVEWKDDMIEITDEKESE